MNQYVSDWGWEDEFAQWMANDCTVCTTLVDTIVPGRIRDPKEAAAVAERLGYEDPFLAVREPFQMWGIQGDESLAEKLPFVKAGLPGVFVTPASPRTKSARSASSTVPIPPSFRVPGLPALISCATACMTRPFAAS